MPQSAMRAPKAIVLSAGQGRRLLPLTSDQPKCLLALDGQWSLLQLQVETLARCGIPRVLVVTGYGADLVEAHLAGLRTPGIQIDTIYNPFFGPSDNLISCWLSRAEMNEDFLLLNGDAPPPRSHHRSCGEIPRRWRALLWVGSRGVSR